MKTSRTIRVVKPPRPSEATNAAPPERVPEREPEARRERNPARESNPGPAAEGTLYLAVAAAGIFPPYAVCVLRAGGTNATLAFQLAERLMSVAEIRAAVSALTSFTNLPPVVVVTNSEALARHEEDAAAAAAAIPAALAAALRSPTRARHAPGSRASLVSELRGAARAARVRGWRHSPEDAVIAACVKAAERLSREQCPVTNPAAESVLGELGRTLTALF